MIVIAALLAVLLGLPSFAIGFFLDDYHQIGLIEGWHDFEVPALNLYASFLDFPGVPWWTSPEARTGFWRPISSATLRLDHALFGRQAPLWHAHSLLWLAALVAVVGLLYRYLPPPVGALALLLFALDEAHAMTAGVLCNRHALATAVPALLGLWAHLRWREEGWRAGRLLSPLLFLLALGFGETTIPVMAYALAYELFARHEAWPRRLAAIAPAAILAIAYVVAYSGFELGPRGASFYINPLEEPGRYASALALHVPALLAGGLAAFPASLWMAGEALQAWLVAVGAISALGLAAWCRQAWPSLPAGHRKALAWCLGGALGALPPLAAAPPSDRQLLVPAVGLSAVLAILIERAWRARRAGTRVATAMAVLLLVLHGPVASLSRVQTQLGTASLGDRLVEVVAGLELLGDRRPAHTPPVRFVVAYLPDFFTAVYPNAIWDFRRGPGTMRWHILTMAPVPQELVRTGPATLELRAVEGRYLTSWSEQLLRARGSVTEAGAEVETPGMRIRVLEVAPDPDADGSPLPTALQFTFDQSLDAAPFRLVTWKGGRFELLDLPDPGGRLRLEPHPGLMGLL